MRRPRLLVVCVVALTLVLAAWSVHQGRVGPTPFLEGRLSVLVFLWAVILFVFRRVLLCNAWIAATCAAAAWVSVFRYETAYLGAPAMAYLTIWLGLQNPRRLWFVAGADYSYGMYLYGFAIQQSVVRCLPLEYRVWWVTGPLALVFSALVAYLSWTLIEKKVLEHKSIILQAVNLVVSKLGLAKSAPLSGKQQTEKASGVRRSLVRVFLVLAAFVVFIAGVEQAIEYEKVQEIFSR